MTPRFWCWLAVLAVPLAVMVPVRAHERANPPASPSPSAFPTPDPSVRMPSSPQPPFKAPAKLSIPQWKKGQTWTVECDYPDALTTSKPPWIGGHQRRSAGHPKFAFTVDRVADVKGLRLFSVQVRPASQDQRTTADLVFAGALKEDGSLANLFLMKGLYRVPTGSGNQVTRRDYNTQAKAPFPVINDVSGVPTDFPMLSADELARHDGKLDGVWKEYEAAEEIEGDKRSRSVRQTILFASDKMQFGERIKVSAPRAECVDVFMKLLNAPGNETLRLVFHPAYPWPVYGEGPKGRFWLVP